LQIQQEQLNRHAVIVENYEATVRLDVNDPNIAVQYVGKMVI
jgi:hypothetical protein